MTNNADDKLKRTLMAKTKAELVEDYIAAQKRHIKAFKELAEKYSAVLDEVKTLRSENARLALSKSVLNGQFQQIQHESSKCYKN